MYIGMSKNTMAVGMSGQMYLEYSSVLINSNMYITIKGSLIIQSKIPLLRLYVQDYTIQKITCILRHTELKKCPSGCAKHPWQTAEFAGGSYGQQGISHATACPAKPFLTGSHWVVPVNFHLLSATMGPTDH